MIVCRIGILFIFYARRAYCFTNVTALFANFVAFVAVQVTILVIVTVFQRLALLKLAHDLIAARTKLLALTVMGNANNVRRIDFNEHQTAILTTIAVGIFVATSVKSSGASNIGVIVNLVASHFENLTNIIIKLMGVLVHIVKVNTLISKKMSIWSNRHVFMFQKPIKLVYCSLGRIGLQTIKKLQQCLVWFVFAHKSNCTINTVIVDFFIFVISNAIFNNNVAFTQVLNRSTNIKKIFNILLRCIFVVQ